VKEESCIRIVPAEPEVIYVPRYDPEVVYGQPYAPYLGPALTFGVGFAVGSWLNYDCDWPRRRVCVGDWNRGWKQDWNWKRGGDYAVNVVNIHRDSARFWEPSPWIRRQHRQRQRNYNFNLNGRRGDARDAGRRFAAVARPSLPGFDGGGEFRARGERRGGGDKGGKKGEKGKD
jgi:hypothetical protein